MTFLRWLKELGKISKEIFTKPKTFLSLARGHHIPPSFQERLMLVVTGVKKCRYCEFVHSKRSLACGMNEDDIAELLNGETDSKPDEEVPALRYAKKWAEQDGELPEEDYESLKRKYGENKAEEINLILQMIKFGNRTGNSWDRFMQKITGGLAGVTEQSSSA